jgi:hypothetical protein
MDKLPEVASNVYVIALLDILDPDPATGDGLLLAGKFCRLFGGLGSTQLWMACVDIDATVADSGPIL